MQPPEDFEDELERIRQRKLKSMFQRIRKEEEAMKTRIVIPVEDEGGLDAQISWHFGRAPYFSIIELDENGEIVSHQTVPNTSEHFGGAGKPAQNILRLQPHVVITHDMGPRALFMFQNAQVAVLRTDAETVREAITAYNRGELTELTEGCLRARHR